MCVSLFGNKTTLRILFICLRLLSSWMFPQKPPPCRLNKVKIRKETLLTRHLQLSPAMRSGTGASVVNGRWAVDPPGEYQAGGTTFTYSRPRAQAEGEEEKGESLRAPGPTTTQLQLYVSTGQQEGIYFNLVSKHELGHGKMKSVIRITHIHRTPIYTLISAHLFNMAVSPRQHSFWSALCQDLPDRRHYFSIMVGYRQLYSSLA